MARKRRKDEVSKADLMGVATNLPASDSPAKNEALNDADELKALRKSYADLKISEEKYHKMVSEVQDYAIILLDIDGTVLNWNRGAKRIKQYSEAEVVGQPFQIFYLPEDRQNGLPERLLQLARDNGHATHEGWRLRKDKSKFWGSIALTALHDDENRIIGFSKVTRDLTEKKLSEDRLNDFTKTLQETNEALRKSEEQYQQMVAEVEDYAIILLDELGNIQNWNVGAEKIKGYSASEVIGKNFNIFYTPEDRQAGLPEKLLHHAATNEKAVHEGWRVRKDGTWFWGSIVITALHRKDGSVFGFSKVTRDLTERKTAEDKLQAYLHELELQNAELEQFAYVASHDLQEPLRKIQTFCNVISENLEDSTKVKQYLAKVDKSITRMKSLIHSILNYSSLSKTGEDKTPTDLNEIIRNVISDFDLLIQEKNGSVEAAHLPVVEGIPLQITQLFANIIGNALKYSDKPSLIRIRCRLVDAGQILNMPVNLPQRKYIEIQFEDNGIGFEQQYEKVIFAMFQRLHGTNEYSGTGIGLALCKKIMDSHQGHITATSIPGHGSTFYVYFPAR